MKTKSIRGPKSEGDTVRDVPPAYAQGPVPNEMKAKLEQLSHQDRRVRSLIDVPLWNRASWSAVLYAINPRMDPPLIPGVGIQRP